MLKFAIYDILQLSNSVYVQCPCLSKPTRVHNINERYTEYASPFYRQINNLQST